MNNACKEIDSVILCGGLGKRLKAIVGDRPKAMAQINQKPFLDILIEYLITFECKRVILCIGHLGEAIKAYYKQRQFPIEIVFSEENEPLGTGGALKNAKPLITSKTFLAMNGDSFCSVDLNTFLDFHRQKGALLSVVVAASEYSRDYASVTLSEDKRIVDFKEKSNISGSTLINAGVYLMQKDIFLNMPKRDSFSLELDVFPQMLDLACYGFLSDVSCIDIGTPQRYEEAKRILQ
ncbi:nucleotidyltransferase family protein [Candidatus Omnitrophota bacterium]